MAVSSSDQLLKVLNLPLSTCIIDYVVELTIEVVNHGLGRRPLDHVRDAVHVKFRDFVYQLVQRAEVTVPMLLITVTYIVRSKNLIHIPMPEWAFERVFMGALIVASKYHNDCSLKNQCWSVASGVFSPYDICRVEREMLEVLKFELRVSLDELTVHETPLLSTSTFGNYPLSRATFWLDDFDALDDDSDYYEEDSDCDSDSSPSLNNLDSPTTSDNSPLPVTPLLLPPDITSLKIESSKASSDSQLIQAVTVTSAC